MEVEGGGGGVLRGRGEGKWKWKEAAEGYKGGGRRRRRRRADVRSFQAFFFAEHLNTSQPQKVEKQKTENR